MMRQAQALAVMMRGDSVFLTGAPGAGKTYVLNKFIRLAKHAGKNVAVTASTGIAATHVGGTTIHSWSGLGIKDVLTQWDIDKLKASAKYMKRYNATDVLVIDEVSMLHGARLDMVNMVAKALRQNPAPFGGMQVILVGDLFQLPPITRGSSNVDFAHLSAAWAELDPKICYLTEQHRVTSGDILLDLLGSMRRGDVNEFHEEALRERLQMMPRASETVTKLYSHNVDVDTINQQHLAALHGDMHRYTATTKGVAAKREQLLKGMLAPEVLELRKGAEIMFVANNFAKGFVNGSRGTVIGFDDTNPIVVLAEGREITVEPHTWSLEEDGRVVAEAVQYPLRLAWAITIHKSQGMSLDAAEIDLSRSFTPGMGYVALSRVRSMEGIYLRGINQVALQLHPLIFDFDGALREASEGLAATTDDYIEEITADEIAPAESLELFEELRTWRRDRAAKDGVPAYIVLHDKTLHELAARRPVTEQALQGVNGFGKAKIEKYATEILRILQQEK
jgi:ATP-dependent exoDNAse (exonuclease V) alpha subunit